MKSDKHITAVDISRDLTLLLRKRFPGAYKDIDITEGFDRPCMTMEVGTIIASAHNEGYQLDRVPVTIYYFAPDRDNSYLDLLHTQAKLRQMLESPMLLGGSYLYPMDGVEFYVVKSDGALTAQLEYELRQPRPLGELWEPMHPDIPLNEEPMEELYVDNDLNN